MVCILSNGMWIALPLLRDPQPALDDAPSRLVHITMVHEKHKPFVALPDAVDPYFCGLAVGSSPEAGSTDELISVSTDSTGSNLIIVGPQTHPSYASSREVSTLPLDSQGRRTSFGSVAHDESSPTRCYVCWPHRNRPEGCHYGVLCERCHLDHPELPQRLRTRRCRGPRRH